jgi:5'-deoxynucleotidase YfbR-like HD superfamily hydrolase
MTLHTYAPVSATTEIEALTGLADLVLALGRVERITCHPDGVTRESDTDHSLMLVIVGCAFAARHFPDLDLGAVAQYAAVHDLVEAMDGVGDTPTLAITAEEHAAKTAREAAGWETLRRRYGAAFPWLSATINAYLRQDSAEARFVWGLDKELPKLTHLLNGCTTHRTLCMTAEQVDSRYRERLAEISPHLSDLPALLALCEELATAVGDAVRCDPRPCEEGSWPS